MKSKNLTFIIFTAILFIGTISFFVPRANLEPIFDETGVIQYFEGMKEGQGLQSTLDFFKKNGRDIWYEPAEGPSKRPLQRLYRPLQVSTVSFKVLTFHVFHNWPLIPVLINAILLALAGALLYLLGFRLTNDHFASAGGAFLMMYSAPALTGTWVVVTGEHALVPVLVCASVLCYFHFKQSSSWSWVVPVVLISFFGPLYKEYVSIAAFVIFAAELISPHRNWRFLLMMLPLLFHSVYTSFFINIIFFKNVVLLSTFQKTHLSDEALSFNIKFHALKHLFFIVPPLLSLLGVAGILSELRRSKMYWAQKPWLRTGATVVLLLAWSSLFVSSKVATVLAVIISLSAFRINRLLGILVLFMWLPYLLAYNVEVHLMYAIGPFAIVLLWYARRLFEHFRTERKKAVPYYLAMVVGVLLIVVFADQSLNLVAAYRTFKGTNSAAKDIARVIANSSEDKPIALISHTLLGDDIKYYLAKKEGKRLDEKGYTFVKAVGENNPQYYGDEEKFKQLLDRDSERMAIFLLDVDLKEPTKLSIFRESMTHKAVNLHTHTIDVRYPYADPFKYFIPMRDASYPGSPDLGDYVTMDKGAFYRRVYARHTLYIVEP